MDPAFFGLLDFTGIPVGVPVVVPAAGKGFKGAGRRNAIRALILQEHYRALAERAMRKRSLLDDAAEREKKTVEAFAKLEAAHEKRGVEAAIYTAFLSEV